MFGERTGDAIQIHERTPGGKWWFSMWDAEGAFGTFGQANTINEFDNNLLVPENGSRNPTINTDALTTRLVLRRFYQSPEFRIAWADRMQKHFFNGGVLSPAVIVPMQASMKNMITPIIKAVNGGTYWDGWWSDWVMGSNRNQTFFNQCRTLGMWPVTAAPALSRASGTMPSGQTLSVTHTNAPANHTLYITTDGSDPRAIGGAVAGTAYIAPVSITAPTRVRARVRNNTTSEWSPIAEGDYAPPPPQLTFTEIHYNPPGAGDAAEFIEIANVGGGVASLNGARFTSGISFTFGNVTLAAGQRLVLVRNAAAHPGVTIAGVYTGALNNSGDTVTLVDFANQPIATVTYGDSTAPGWPVLPDGEGHSLVLMRPWLNPDVNLPANWRASALPAGAPGAVDSLAFAGVTTDDADADGYSAMVEYALGTSDANGTPPLVSTHMTNGDLFVSVTHPIAADEAILTAEESPDLTAWTNAVWESSTPDGLGNTTTVWRCAAPAETSRRVFVKIRVTQRTP